MSSSITGNKTIDPGRYANITITPVAVQLLLEMNQWATNQSEDCLTLNVWTRPQTGEGNKAVLVWIHGGAYISGDSSAFSWMIHNADVRSIGGSAVPWYNGQYLAGKEDVVVVSIK